MGLEVSFPEAWGDPGRGPGRTFGLGTQTKRTGGCDRETNKNLSLESDRSLSPANENFPAQSVFAVKAAVIELAFLSYIDI